MTLDPYARRYDALVPNRTIYVSDEDQAVFRRAQELAGDNLSAAITNALKRYVAVEEGRLSGYDEITVKVGLGARRKVRFAAILLGEWAKTEGERYEIFRVYRGKTGKYALHIERMPYYEMRDAEGNPLTGWRAWTGIGMAAGGGTGAEATLDVFDSLDQLRDRIPAELYDMVATSVDLPYVEDLDI